MADFPLAVNLQGDYGFKVVVVDDEDTIAAVIGKAVDQIAGVLVAPFPEDAVLKAKVHGADETLQPDITVKQANLPQMEAIDIVTSD